MVTKLDSDFTEPKYDYMNRYNLVRAHERTVLKFNLYFGISNCSAIHSS
jgi:hypothetical protein